MLFQNKKRSDENIKVDEYDGELTEAELSMVVGGRGRIIDYTPTPTSVTDPTTTTTPYTRPQQLIPATDLML